MKLLEQKAQQFLDTVTTLGHQRVMDIDGDQTLQNFILTYGCCDAKYPGFEEVRMVYIFVPARATTGVNN